MLLDTLLSICKGQYISNIHEVTKRKFDQYSTLREIIVNSCAEAFVEIQLNCESNVLSQDLSPDCIVTDIPFEWNTNEALKRNITSTKQSKSYKKLVQLTNEYFHNNSYIGNGIVSVIGIAINQIYSQVFS